MEEETLFERLAHERNITVEEKRVPWEWIPELGRYPRQRSGSGMRWSGSRPKGAAICCAGIRTFEYRCIGIKTAEMNTFVGDFPAVFSCAKFY